MSITDNNKVAVPKIRRFAERERQSIVYLCHRYTIDRKFYGDLVEETFRKHTELNS